MNEQAGLMGSAALQTMWEVMTQNRKKRPLASTAAMR
jgi:hypothetical protein